MRISLLSFTELRVESRHGLLLLSQFFVTCVATLCAITLLFVRLACKPQLVLLSQRDILQATHFHVPGLLRERWQDKHLRTSSDSSHMRLENCVSSFFFPHLHRLDVTLHSSSASAYSYAAGTPGLTACDAAQCVGLFAGAKLPPKTV